MPKGYSKGLPLQPPRGNPPPIPAVRPVMRPIGPSIAYVRLTKGQWSLIDVEDADYVGRWNWHAKYSKEVRTYRAGRLEYFEDGHTEYVAMHSDLLGLRGRALTADHVDIYRTLDNRKINLRIASQGEQARNKRRYKNNTSGFKGVSWHRGKWVARIQVDGRRRIVGRYETPTEAHMAYIEAALKEFGAFARTE